VADLDHPLGSGDNAAILVTDDFETGGWIDIDDEIKVKSRPAYLHISTQALGRLDSSSRQSPVACRQSSISVAGKFA
jgi:hypothetical protein